VIITHRGGAGEAVAASVQPLCSDAILFAVGPGAAERLRELEMPIQNYEWRSARVRGG
jgi:hypothetical protein